MLIIDGYNILMQMELKEKKLENKRNRFLNILNKRHKMFGGITVVFDGKDEVEGSYIKEKSAVKVIYTKGESADDCIKSSIEKSKNPRAITVATDDREVKDFAKMYGCKHIFSSDLIEKILPRQKEVLPPEPEKDILVDSDKGKAITDALKKEWEK
jgi:predicted RNA-binding protein with PIN domain